MSSFWKKTNRKNSMQAFVPLTTMDFTEEQKNAIAELRKRIGDKMPNSLDTDYELYKWLKGIQIFILIILYL